MALISLRSLSVSFGERTLFDPFDLDINEGEKIGLIGANGAGKTTLLKLITGHIEPDSGGIVRQKGLKVGYMEQIVASGSDVTAYDAALEVFSHLIRTEEQLNALADVLAGADEDTVTRHHDLLERFEREGGLTYKNRTRAALIGLGLSEEQLSLPLKKLSGGQLSKISLARLLLGDSQLMLLDEPTNHLDIKSVEWLENFIKSSRRAALIISHDRYFLDLITSRTVEIEHSRVAVFRGAYTDYLKFKEEERAAARKKYENTLAEIERLEGVIKQQHQWNREKNIRTADSKQKEVDRLRATLVKPESEFDGIRFAFRPKTGGGSETVVAHGISRGYNGNLLYSDVSFKIARGERVFLLGENGCGKTTLLKQLMSEGDGVRFGPSVSVSYFDQTQSDLNDRLTAFEEIHEHFPDKTESDIRGALAAFLFKGDDVFKKVGSLSGGERARLSILKIMLGASNFLLLDEPTNHLDVYSRQALEQALEQYGGTMLIVSHDRRFIDKLADRIFVMEKGGITVYNGNYTYYLSKRPDDVQEEPVQKAVGAGGQAYKEKKKLASDIRRIKSGISETEKRTGELEKELDGINAQLSLPETASDYIRTMELTARAQEIDTELTDLLDRWTELSEQLEQLQNQ